MSRLLYFDCFSGISGDMVLGALLDAGLPLTDLSAALRSLALPGCEVAAERVLRCGVAATKFRVFENGRELDRVPAGRDDRDHRGHDDHQGHGHDHHDHGHDHHRHGDEHSSHQHHSHSEHQGTGQQGGEHLGTDQASARHLGAHRPVSDILALIDRSALSSDGRRRAKALFERLAEAEASIHQVPVEKVHLHEVGATDSIIDIVGAVFALEWSGADQIVCSPINVGGGMVRSAHGLFPVPAPATLKLLGDAPIYGGTVQKELVTPTGALIVTSYASSFGPVPPMSIEHVGYGAGDRDHAGTPNVLRVLVGRPSARVGDRVVVIECEIDDMNPQLFGSAMERLYAAGALEVFYVPVQMKKNRPGTLLTVVAPPRLGGDLAEVIFRETTTIGLRRYEVERECLEREVVSVETPLGPVRFKLARRNGRVINAVPEFEDCAALAKQHGRSVKEVQAVATGTYSAAHQSREGGTS